MSTRTRNKSAHKKSAKAVHPIDQNGKLCSFADIPDHLEKLRDDPYRSLAGYVRNAGGYEKAPTPHRGVHFRPELRDRNLAKNHPR